jgi:hypothetical protein
MYLAKHAKKSFYLGSGLKKLQERKSQFSIIGYLGEIAALSKITIKKSRAAF